MKVALTIPRNINALATILDTQDNLDTEQLDKRATFPKGKLAKLIEFSAVVSHSIARCSKNMASENHVFATSAEYALI